MAAEGKRVVMICVDNSEFADHAIDFYAKEIKQDNDYVVFGHCPELYDFHWASPAVVDKLLNELSEKVKELEKKCNAKVSQELNLPGKFKTGEGKKPGEVMCDMAEAEKAQLIVIGSRGLGAIRRRFLGSVSDYIIHHAHVPVLVCKAPHGHHA